MGRVQKNLQVRNKFYILTNGKESEKNYFKLVKTKRSIYDVKIEFHNCDPLGLVKCATKLTNVNQIWCVFDIDDTSECGTLISAINLANKNNVQIAFSNMAFEVWLLSHFNKVTKLMNNNELITEMNKLLSQELNTGKKYDKSDEELLKKYFIPKLDDAIKNSKIEYQKFVAKYEKENNGDKNYKIWEWNPCSNVFKLIEALHLMKK